MLTRRALSIVAMLGLGAGIAVASPPWFTEWVRTTPWKHILARVAFVTTYKQGQHKTELPRIVLAYGLTPKSELIFKASDIYLTKGATAPSGPSDVQLGYKQRFIDRPDGVQVAFDYFVSLPTGAPSLGTGSNGYDQNVAFLAGKRFKSGQQVSLSLGATVYGRLTGKANASAGILYTRAYAHSLTVGAEIDANTPQKAASRSDFTWGVGIMKSISPKQLILARVGRSTQGFSSLNLFVGLQTDWKP